MTKLFKIPEFSPLPSSTDAANVTENIIFWIKEKKEGQLKAYCRVDLTEPLGYRFVKEEDFEETIIETQRVKGVDLKFTFTRLAERRNLCYYPLHFTQRRINILYSYEGIEEEYQSEAKLKRFIKQIKND